MPRPAGVRVGGLDDREERDAGRAGLAVADARLGAAQRRDAERAEDGVVERAGAVEVGDGDRDVVEEEGHGDFVARLPAAC